jgi:hypothetical protein
MYGGAGLVGLVSCFFGYKLFKGLIIALMALTGAAALAWLGYHYGEEPVLWSAGGFLIGVILGGVMALFFYSLAVGTIAALFVATTLLPWVQPYEPWIQWSVIGVACLLAAFVAAGLTNLMIQLASAMLGALLLVHSALFFTTGQTVHQALESEDGWMLYLDLDLKIAVIALVVGLLGFLVQRRAAK